MTLEVGQVIQERYRIVSALGQGGVGTVYRAWDARLKKPVALKEMFAQPELDPGTLAQWRQQFDQEAGTLARLKDNHLVGVTDYFEELSNAYLVMEFVEGEGLRRRIEREGSLPEAQVLDWAKQLLDALTYCHDQDIIHRDISPQNVIIRPDGRAVLVDFGLVKLWDRQDPRTRAAMQGMGKPECAPPEQYDAHSGHTDARSDIYSLGATLYHALTGKAPATAAQRIVDSTSLTALRQLKPHIDVGLEAAIMRSLELQPSARFRTAAEMAAALDGNGDQSFHSDASSDRGETKSMRGIDSEPADIGLLIARARASIAEGDYEAALATCQRALEISPDEARVSDVRSRAWVQKGDALQRNDLDGALIAYREAGDASRVAEIQRLQRQRAISRLETQAQAHEQTGRWGEAAAHYERLVADYPGEKRQAAWKAAAGRCRQEEALAQLFDTGRDALQRGDWEEAQKLFAKLVNRRIRYVKDGVRATHMLDSAAAEGRTPAKIWERIPHCGWIAGALVTVAVAAAVLAASDAPLPGLLHFVSDRSGKREIHRLSKKGAIIGVTHTASDAESWVPAISPRGALMFVSDRNGKREVYRLTQEAEVVRVTHTADGGESWLAPH